MKHHLTINSQRTGVVICFHSLPSPRLSTNNCGINKGSKQGGRKPLTSLPESPLWTSHQKTTNRDSSGSRMVRTPHSPCQGHGFHPWSGNLDPPCCTEQPEKQKLKKKKKRHFYIFSPDHSGIVYELTTSKQIKSSSVL